MTLEDLEVKMVFSDGSEGICEIFELLEALV
jgi:hypothetical protein